MVYKWNSAARVKSDAQKTGELFEKLEKTGGLTPARVVDASREKDSLLHKEFEWNDSIAAEAYREQQARVLICMIQIEPEEEKAEPVRAFFNVEYGSKHYESTKIVLEDAEKTSALLSMALSDLRAFQRKYAGLKALSSVFEAIDEAVAS